MGHIHAHTRKASEGIPWNWNWNFAFIPAFCVRSKLFFLSLLSHLILSVLTIQVTTMNAGELLADSLSPGTVFGFSFDKGSS